MGERRAFDHLYRNGLPLAAKTLREAGCPAADVDDFFQEALLALYQQVVDGRFELRSDTKVTTYLVRLCRNRWIDRTRRVEHRRTQLVDSHPESALGLGGDEVEEEWQTREAQLQALDAAFAQLGERCQHMLRRFYHDRVALADIAIERDITPSTAKNEKYRCMQRLRKLHTPGQTLTDEHSL